MVATRRAAMPIRIDEEVTFRKLETLLAFLEAGNLARAAERLGVSAVTVHRSLHALEAGLRCPLFRIEGRNLQPLEAAHALADAARRVLAAMDEGIRATRQAAGYASDRIRIGSLYSLTARAVPTVVRGLKLRLPELHTELVLGSNMELQRSLRDGGIDAALMAVPEGAADLESQPLFVDDIYFAAPAGSRYATLGEVDLRGCAEERFVSLGEGFATYGGFVEAFRVAGFKPDVVMTTGDIFTLMNLVAGGVGCTLLPGRVRGVLADKVQLIPLQPRYLMRQTIGLSFLRTRERDPNLLALLTVCRTSAAELHA